MLFKGTHLRLLDKSWRFDAQHSDHTQEYSIINFKVFDKRS